MFRQRRTCRCLAQIARMRGAAQYACRCGALRDAMRVAQCALRAIRCFTRRLLPAYYEAAADCHITLRLLVCQSGESEEVW